MKERRRLASARRKSQRWMDAKKDSREDGKNDGWEEDMRPDCAGRWTVCCVWYGIGRYGIFTSTVIFFREFEVKL